MKKYIAPSVLSADFSRLGEDIRLVSEAGAEYIHLDVMDGSFVPNITFGAGVVRDVRPFSDSIFDVHLMIENPERFIESFAEAGADVIHVHAEACRHLDRVLNQIRECGVKAGLVLNPATPISVLDWCLQAVDVVLLMTVNPGFGNQKIIPYAKEKITACRQFLDERKPEVPIEIDGGVNLNNCRELAAAGADILVAGSAVFKDDPAENVKLMNMLLNEQRRKG